ncbi:MAG TPA: GntR family transcriptional regulator [Burkholderiales bacterium]|nr:GntR family transcriptional regulator [Burkholderiales bacterium]
MPAQRAATTLAKAASAPALPRYAQIANELIEQIVRGKYPIGSLLPREIELSEHYRVSRHTMREALRRLTDTGMVSRRRRAGTEVISASPPAPYRQPVNSIDDLLQYGEGTNVRVLGRERVKCDAELAGFLGCAVGDEWLRVETTRQQDGDSPPICLTSNYLSLELPGIERLVRRLTGPISAMLEREYGLRIATIEQSMQAVQLRKPEARVLQVKAGTAGLRAVRRYFDASSRLLEVSDALHAGERFTYVTRLQRST